MSATGRWQRVPLESLAEKREHSIAIGPFGSDLKVSDYTESGVPVIFVRNVRPGAFDASQLRFVSVGKAKQLAAHIVRGGDLVATKMGDPPCVSAIYHENAPPAVITADLIKVSIDRSVAEPRFVMHYLNSDDAKGQVQRFTTGVTRPKVTLRDFRQIQVPFPPLPEQRRIADILDKADALQAKRRAALAQLDTLTQSIFLDMFGDPVMNTMSWASTTLRQLVTLPLRNGLSPSEGGAIKARVLTLAAVTGNGFNRDAWKTSTFRCAPQTQHSVRREDLLICRGNGNRDLVGRGYFAPEGMNDVAFPDTMIAARIDLSKVTREFIEHLWNSQLVRRQIDAGARTTNGTLKVNQSVLEAIRLLTPPLTLQRSFSLRVAHVEMIKRRLEISDVAAAELDATLRNCAFNGTL